MMASANDTGGLPPVVKCRSVSYVRYSHCTFAATFCAYCRYVWNAIVFENTQTNLQCALESREKTLRFAEDTSKTLSVKRKKSLSRGPGGFTCSLLCFLNKILIVCKSKVATA